MKSKTRTRRLRRQRKAGLKNPAASPTHKSRSGRIGRIFSKKLKGLHDQT